MSCSAYFSSSAPAPTQHPNHPSIKLNDLRSATGYSQSFSTILRHIYTASFFIERPVSLSSR